MSATLAEAIRDGLADDITAGRLAPGREIDELAIAQRFGASRTPVREALRELAATGLVEIAPRRGARVASLTLDRLGQLFELMAETEAMCVRIAAHRMTLAHRFALQSVHEAASRAVAAGDVAAYDAQNRLFHQTIYNGTGNVAMVEYATGLRFRLAPFHRAQFHGPQRLSRSHAEHETVLIQIMRCDGDEAALAMRAHMLAASATLAGYLSAGAMRGEEPAGQPLLPIDQ